MTIELTELQAQTAQTLRAMDSRATAPTVPNDLAEQILSTHRDTCVEETKGKAVSAGRHNKRNLLLGGLVAAAAAALVFAVTVAPTVSIGGQPPSAQASASEFLSQLAGTQTSNPKNFENASYWKITSLTTRADGSSSTETQWVGRAPMGGQFHTRNGSVEKISNDSGATWDAYTLSSKPVDLQRLIDKELGQSTGTSAMGIISSYLAQPTRPDTRAALLRIAADLPGAVNSGTTTDAVGRTGTAIDVPDDVPGIPKGQVTSRYIFDADGTLLEWAKIAASGTPAVPTDPDGKYTSSTNTFGLSPDGSRPTLKPGDYLIRHTFIECGPTDIRPM